MNAIVQLPSEPVCVVAFDEDSAAAVLMHGLAAWVERFADGLLSAPQAHLLLDMLSEIITGYDKREADLVQRRSDGENVVMELGHVRWDNDMFARLFNRVVLVNRQRRNELRLAVPSEPSNAWRKGQESLIGWGPIKSRGFRFGCCNCDAEHCLDFKVILEDGSELHTNDYTLELKVY